MKVRDLIAALRAHDDDDEVRFAYGAGDYVDTTVTDEVTHVETVQLEWSSYHETWKMPHKRNDDTDNDYVHKTSRAVVLR